MPHPTLTFKPYPPPSPRPTVHTAKAKDVSFVLPHRLEEAGRGIAHDLCCRRYEADDLIATATALACARQAPSAQAQPSRLLPRRLRTDRVDIRCGRASVQAADVLIVTTDKDLSQLVTEAHTGGGSGGTRVRVYNDKSKAAPRAQTSATAPAPVRSRSRL